MRKVGVYIDGPNLWASTQALNIQCNWHSLLDWLRATHDAYQVNYYTAVRTEDSGFIPIKKMLDHIEYSGIRVVQKPVKIISRGNNQDALLKGNLDVELATDMMVGAEYFNYMMLFSGDGDFTYLIQKLRERGIHVTIISSVSRDTEGSNMIADSLRRAADTFLNLSEWEKLKLPFIVKSGEINMKDK